MANKRPEHRKGTTGRDYRKLQAWVYASSTICARCGNSRGPIVRQGCDHPTHQGQPYCPTHPLAPSLGHKDDLQFGGRTTRQNSQLEHFGCNAEAGALSRSTKARPNHQSWSI